MIHNERDVMKMSVAQLNKLTPAQKKARAKRLEYNRRYDAMKSAHKIAKAIAPKIKKAANKAYKDYVKSSDVEANALDRLETLIRELRDVTTKRNSIVEEIKTIKL